MGGQLIASDPTLDNFGLTLVTKPDRSGVVVRFNGVPGNQPHAYGNTVALWDSWSLIVTGPHAQTPLRVVAIDERRAAFRRARGLAVHRHGLSTHLSGGRAGDDDVRGVADLCSPAAVDGRAS